MGGKGKSHFLNLPTKNLGYRLEEIVKSLHANLGK
jgi:hypothetical protein